MRMYTLLTNQYNGTVAAYDQEMLKVRGIRMLEGKQRSEWEEAILNGPVSPLPFVDAKGDVKATD